MQQERPSLALLPKADNKVMDPSYILYVHQNPGKAFCLGCLARLSPPISPADAPQVIGKVFLEGLEVCSSCGRRTTVYRAE